MNQETLPPELEQSLRSGIAAVRAEEYLIGFNIFSDLYGGGYVPGTAEGLSYYALTLALVSKRTKDAIDMCTKALKMQPFEPAHYVNLAKIYVASDQRKKAVSALEQGLKRLPRNKMIISYWRVIGIRSKPPIPFLSRDNFINVVIGRKRHQKKEVERAARRKKKEESTPK